MPYLALAGWTAAGLFALALRHALRGEARREAERDLRRPERLSDTPAMRFAATWSPSA